MGAISFPDLWLAEAEAYRAAGEELAAELSEIHARQFLVHCRLAGRGDPGLLTVRQAAERSGLSTGYLRHLIGGGKVTNAGGPSRPRIRVADLPQRKRRGRGTKGPKAIHDPASGILSLFGSKDRVAKGG